MRARPLPKIAPKVANSKAKMATVNAALAQNSDGNFSPAQPTATRTTINSKVVSENRYRNMMASIAPPVPILRLSRRRFLLVFAPEPAMVTAQRCRFDQLQEKYATQEGRGHCRYEMASQTQ